MGRRTYKRVTLNGNVTLHQRYIYRGYLQIACIDLTRSHHPALWFITWDPTQRIATRPLAIQKNGTWYTYGLDLTKNVCEVFGSSGYIGTAYTYTPYGQVTATGNVDQPIQWSSEYHDAEPDLVYYNYRYFNANRGRFLSVDPVYNKRVNNSYNIARNSTFKDVDILGLLSVNDVLELADQTETANVKNILIAVEIAILMKASQKAQIELRKAIIKRNRKQVDLWERRKNIICRYAREASKICL